MLFKVGRTAGVAGLAAPWDCRNWAVSSAYPAWNIPTRGLSAREGQTAWTSENLALLRNTSRKVADCFSMPRNAQNL